MTNTKKNHKRCVTCRSAIERERVRANPEGARKAAREWAVRNPEKAAEIRRRHYEKNRDAIIAKRHPNKLKYGYGLTEEQYDGMLETQSGVCAVCRGVNENGTRLAVDHDHATHLIRGLLCQRCNHGIGQFRDNPELLTRAIQYLADPPSNIPMPERISGPAPAQR